MRYNLEDCATRDLIKELAKRRLVSEESRKLEGIALKNITKDFHECLQGPVVNKDGYKAVGTIEDKQT